MQTRMPPAVGLVLWSLLLGEAAAQTASSSPTAGSHVSGQVVSNFGGVVTEATVTLVRREADGSLAEPIIVASDRQGTFKFDHVAPGRYQLTAAKAGYTGRSVILSGTVGPTARTSSARMEAGVELTVTPGQNIAGRVLALRRAASIAGRIAEPDGIPAPDVEVFVAVRHDSSYTVLQATRTTSAWDGRYEISDLPPGDYLVVVRPTPSSDPARALANAERRAPESSPSTRPSFAPTLYPGVTDVDRASSVTLFEGIAAEGIDVWLTPAQRFSVSGRVFWPDDLSIDNLAIEYTSVAAQRSGLWFVSDPGGLFTMTGVPAGTLVMLARADSAQGPLAGIASTDVSQGDVEDVRLTLGKPGVIEGRVVYEVERPPVSETPGTIALRQTLVHVSPLYPTPESPIAPDGRFRLEGALGEYDFELRGVPGARITRVTRYGRPLVNNHIGVAANDVIGGIEITVGK